MIGREAVSAGTDDWRDRVGGDGAAPGRGGRGAEATEEDMDDEDHLFSLR